jgi:hypothetical protein
MSRAGFCTFGELERPERAGKRGSLSTSHHRRYLLPLPEYRNRAHTSDQQVSHNEPLCDAVGIH